MFRITSDFRNDFTHCPCFEIVSYHHTLKYETDEEVISIEIENLPQGLSFKNKTISGNMRPLNTWHPIKDYVRLEIQNRDFNGIYEKDILENPDSNKVATIKYLQDHLNIPHYTGVPELLFGAKAWVMDFKTYIIHHLKIKVKTDKNDYELRVPMFLMPLFSSKHSLANHIKSSGRLIDKNKNPVSLKDFVKEKTKDGTNFAF